MLAGRPQFTLLDAILLTSWKKLRNMSIDQENPSLSGTLRALMVETLKSVHILHLNQF